VLFSSTVESRVVAYGTLTERDPAEAVSEQFLSLITSRGDQ
jgi:hypothetical protein